MDVGVWEGVFVQAAIDDQARVRLWLDVHARRDATKTVGIVRPALGWALTPRLIAFAGYAWVPSAADGEGITSEHRLWQQLWWTVDVGPVGVRPRLEERFGSGDAALRARVFTRAQVPIHGPLSWVVWDEPFVALTNSVFVPAGFDQNRLFVGPALQYEAIRVEAGYLDQRSWRNGEWAAVGVFATNVFLAF